MMSSSSRPREKFEVEVHVHESLKPKYKVAPMVCEVHSEEEEGDDHDHNGDIGVKNYSPCGTYRHKAGKNMSNMTLDEYFKYKRDIAVCRAMDKLNIYRHVAEASESLEEYDKLIEILELKEKADGEERFREIMERRNALNEKWRMESVMLSTISDSISERIKVRTPFRIEEDPQPMPGMPELIPPTLPLRTLKRTPTALTGSHLSTLLYVNVLVHGSCVVVVTEERVH